MGGALKTADSSKPLITHIYFDDQEMHCAASKVVPTARFPLVQPSLLVGPIELDQFLVD